MKLLNTNKKLFLIAYVISILTVFILIISSLSTDKKVIVSSEPTPSPKDNPAVELPIQMPPPLKADPITFPGLVYSVYYDIDTSLEFINLLTENIDVLSTEIASKNYTVEATEKMIKEEARLIEIRAAVSSDVEHYTTWETEHYYAAKVWEYFMQRGYGEVITSAIIGNMMIEAGGHSLNLQPNVYDPTGRYYGLCQWSLYYNPDLADLSFEGQLKHLEESMPYEFKLFGWCYKKGFTYDKFLNMTDPAEAALAFAVVYERCASWGYPPRATAAKVAYNYFKLD